MHSLGRTLGSKFHAGDIVLLNGTLGAGKTSLVQGIGEALGITGITSPTFVISRIYQGKIPLIHVDAYRLVGEPWALFDDLDLESYLPQSVTVVEWGEGLINRIPDNYLEIRLQHGAHENERLVEVIDHGLGISL